MALWRKIPTAAELAIEEDACVIGIASSATDQWFVPKLMNALSAVDVDAIDLNSGVIPRSSFQQPSWWLSIELANLGTFIPELRGPPPNSVPLRAGTR